MKFLFLIVLLAYFVVPSTALECFQCAISQSLCSKETCKSNQLCYSANISAGTVTTFVSGCVDKELCGKTITNTYAGVELKLQPKCCDFNNCNGATAAQLSVLAISIMVLVWFVGFQ
ncbi:sperm acrosome membrane-associated protein 4-like [Hypanus sabinus]|uniref:sperm acrosome membrane-associated protein 4-like n=1 Tax=Hypanus sabinus TaxID=79690 RepID=UPI0028C4F894|nr:sperm acrosome membrane-associated protein 4-like [Hypanus sabinus]XP_059826896.1 sperm acrosome membrane-associated protein 4-like [Hypanus sabinus]